MRRKFKQRLKTYRHAKLAGYVWQINYLTRLINNMEQQGADPEAIETLEKGRQRVAFKKGKLETKVEIPHVSS